MYSRVNDTAEDAWKDGENLWIVLSLVVIT